MSPTKLNSALRLAAVIEKRGAELFHYLSNTGDMSAIPCPREFSRSDFGHVLGIAESLFDNSGVSVIQADNSATQANQ